MQEVRKRHLTLIIPTVVITLLLIILFVPLLALNPFTKSVEENVITDKTHVQSYNVFNPKVVIFTESDDYTVTTHFLKLKRKALVWWQIDTSLKHSAKTETQLSDEEKEIQAEETLESLHDAVVSGTFDENEISEEIINEYSLSETNATEEDDSITTLNSHDGKYEIEMKISSTSSTYLLLNGEKVDGLTRFASPAISTDSKYLYYTKFLAQETDHESGDYLNASGIIYRMNLQTLQEELVYDFKEPHTLSLSATSNKLVYVFDTGEVGVINLESNERKILHRIEVLDYTDPSEIIYIDDTVVKVIPNTPEYLMGGQGEVLEFGL